MREVALNHMLSCLIGLCTLTLSSSTSANDLLQLKEQMWLSPAITDNDKLLSLTKKPSECINPDAPDIAIIGRLAFESPALLGGQAARIGLSCASCHPSSRTNPHFFLENISSAPGTADVTHSFFSSTGGNNILTAVVIPDLAKLDQMKIKNRQSSEFRNKLRELIEVEFDGQSAPRYILDAMQTYLANINTDYCRTTAQHLTLNRVSNDWIRLQENVQALVDHPDKELNQLLIRIARKRLEAIYLRYTNLENLTVTKDLITLSLLLEELSLTKVEHENQNRLLSSWHKKASKSFAALKQYEALSMYNPEVVAKLIHQGEQTPE